jgi:3-oxoacyl-[acyl-carrier-protein] synthase-3
MYATVVGWGHYLPSNILTNDELSQRIDTTDQWIIERTGIQQRHIATEQESTRTLATQAALNALENSGFTPQDIDALLLATTTPDKTFPATAVEVQRDLGMHHGFAFDLQAVCSGFIYALSIADAFVKNRQAQRILIMGAETMSRILDWQDRSSCILFGDGAGALIIEATTGQSSGILSTRLYSDGHFNDLLKVNGGPSSSNLVGTIEMNGREVFRHGVQKMTAAIQQILQDHQLSINDINWIVPHQANKRMLEAIADKLNISNEKMICTVPQHANTSAASIPLALSTAATAGNIQKGQLVLCTALGAGLTWGASLIRW